MSLETISDEGVICPHCGHLHRSGDDPEMHDESLSEWECHSCDKEFRVGASVCWTWTASGSVSDSGAPA